MASPARSRTTDSFGGDLGPAALKGGVLVFVALALGLALLLQGTGADLEASSPSADDESPDDDTGTPGTTDDDGASDDTTATTGDTTSTTAAAPRSPDEVTVLVANASGITGAASTAGATLQAAGYLIAEPDNAPLTTATSVYFITGFEPEARAVATALGLDPAAEGVVGEVPSPVPTDDGSMGAANILVVLGPDVAGGGAGTSTGATDPTVAAGSE